MKSNLFEEGIIIHGNQDTCSVKIVYKRNEMLLDCCKGSLCIVTFMKVIKKCVSGQSEILHSHLTEMYKCYFLMLSNMVEKCGLSEQW